MENKKTSSKNKTMNNTVDNSRYEFRAWDTLNKMMEYDKFFVDPDGEVWYNQNPHGIDMSGIVKIKSTDKLILMQWTGLYDLYECDIIELENWNPKHYVIKFIEGAFCLADLKTGEYVADIHYIHHSGKVQYKIIGNIHQSPNTLLKQL